METSECQLKQISELRCPEPIKEALRELEGVLLDSMGTRGIDFQTGSLWLPPLPRRLRLPYQAFLWMSEANGVIENINP